MLNNTLNKLLYILIIEKVTIPIKNYLLKRPDTLRCIISHLTEDRENYSKLIKEKVKIPSKEQNDDLSSDEDENAAEKWEINSLKDRRKATISII